MIDDLLGPLVVVFVCLLALLPLFWGIAEDFSERLNTVEWELRDLQRNLYGEKHE